MTPKDVVRWIQGRLGWLNKLPSWLNELLSGILCVGVAWLLLVLLGWTGMTFPLAFMLSEGYERWLDPSGYNAQDVVERVRGTVLVLLLAVLIGKCTGHGRPLRNRGPETPPIVREAAGLLLERCGVGTGRGPVLLESGESVSRRVG